MAPKCSPETFAVQAGGHVDGETGAIVPPVHITTTYERDADNGYRRGLIYGRADNPTVRACEHVITELEAGAETLVLSSGMSAATAVFLALPRPAHVIAPKVMYWGLRNWLASEATSFGITVTFVDATDTAAIAAAIRPGDTKLVWIETPSNPLWQLVDIRATAEAAHAAGARVAVDSTAATPVLTRPLDHGADVVMHSATKYLNGHSDVVAGALTFSPAANDLEARVRGLRSSLGTVLGPFEAALLLRGMRTLNVRVARQCESAMRIAERFAGDDRVAAVLYPGLAGHPGRAVAERQMTGGFGGMMSIRCRDGAAHAIATAARLKIWKRATSLGGIESLVEHRASVEGPDTPCPDDLLRLSVGLEAADDLIADLDQALSDTRGVA